MAVDDFIMTIDSDEEDAPLPLPETSKPTKSQKLDTEDAQLNTDFIFDLSGDPYADMIGGSNLHDHVKKGSRPVCACWPLTIAKFC